MDGSSSIDVVAVEPEIDGALVEPDAVVVDAAAAAAPDATPAADGGGDAGGPGDHDLPSCGCDLGGRKQAPVPLFAILAIAGAVLAGVGRRFSCRGESR